MSMVKAMNVLKKHKNDILLVLAVLLVAGAFWLYTAIGRPSGAEVVVSVDGEELCCLPLDEDARLSIGDGDKFNILVISNGEAFIEDASCPDHICVQSGRVSLDGQTIVCLPNKTVISVQGGEEAELDGIAG